jgi:hypothetical protein
MWSLGARADPVADPEAALAADPVAVPAADALAQPRDKPTAGMFACLARPTFT